ncbi:MAG TPA: dephospho-CoA kinase [Acidimicrobiales bacterium]|nr:dephospho-CoA kinase [Acidimicrobiales bacterium]
MIAVGLTGGIGSGKSTVARMLVERGAVLVDADQLAREVVEPGTEGLARVVERFGPEVLLGDGQLDRGRLAAMVFTDEAARRDLNSIVHPAVGRLMAERLAASAGSDDIVVLDIPLLTEAGGRDRYPVAGVLVIDAPVEIAVERLVADGRMGRADAEARVAAQASRAERLAVADYVIVNIGTLEELALMVDRAWTWMEDLRAAGPVA